MIIGGSSNEDVAAQMVSTPPSAVNVLSQDDIFTSESGGTQDSFDRDADAGTPKRIQTSPQLQDPDQHSRFNSISNMHWDHDLMPMFSGSTASTCTGAGSEGLIGHAGTDKSLIAKASPGMTFPEGEDCTDAFTAAGATVDDDEYLFAAVV